MGRRRSVTVTDAQWAKIEPLLPRLARNPRGGRPWADTRRVFEGILWVLKTGARWRDLPPEYPSPSTCWRRLQMWEEQGVWLEMWRTFLGELDRKGRLKWSESFVDASFAPAKGGVLESVAPSGERVRSGWWWSTARVFLWEVSLPRPRPRRSRSSSRRSRGSVSRARGQDARARTRRG
jgi:transposase